MLKSQANNTKQHRQSIKQNSRKMNKLIICSLCLVVSISLLTAKSAEAGRLQEFFQNLVGGGSSSSSGSSSSNSNSNSNSNSGNSNSNSNSNSDSNDPDTAAAGENNGANGADQSMTPMMSAMSPYLRYPSF